MGEKTVSSTVKIDGEITPDFSFDWAIEYKGEKFIMPLRIPQGSKENTSKDSSFELTFQHWAIYQLKRFYFVTMQPIDSGTAVADKYIASVSLNLKEFCDLFSQVLKYWFGDKITLDLNPIWEYEVEPSVISIDYSYCWNVLIEVFALWGVRWQIAPNGDRDHYVIKIGYPSNEISHVFKYGFEGGLLKVERQVQNENIRNILLGRGGDTNLPKLYFKDKDPNNPDFAQDPDFCPDLENIYFDRLRGATFRSYIQGWNARHYGGSATKASAYAPWAWEKGYTDEKFDPVEYVKDDESILQYGELWGGVPNNDDIYPTIQGIIVEPYGRVDEVIDVEQITTDDIADSSDADAAVITIQNGYSYMSIYLDPSDSTVIQTLPRVSFTVPTGKKANLLDDTAISAVFNRGQANKLLTPIESYAQIKNKIINVYDAESGEIRSASGIPEGNYYVEISVEIENLSKDIYKTVNIDSGQLRLQIANETSSGWKKTFNVWIKNVWQTSKLADESDSEYSERVWKSILGDRTGEEAKVVFTSGALAVSEDYEFVITEFPTLDESKSLNGVSSHWKLTLEKSDADYESTGLYIPSTQRQGAAGDHFCFIGTEMTHWYTLQAEIALDNYKKDELALVKDIRPSWLVTPDKVRFGNEGKIGALIDEMQIGALIRLSDKRFNPDNKEELYIQSLTITYNSENLNPDVEIILGTDYSVSASPVTELQGEISALQKQVGTMPNIEQIVRAVVQSIFIESDDKTSPSDRNTFSALRARKEFLSKLTNDRTPFDLAVGGKFTAEQGTQFGESFAEGVSGFGGKIDRFGDGWLGGLHLRNFLEVPELRYNRTEVSIGNDWNAPGGGVIDSVVPDKDGDGNLLLTGTVTLHLEDGEVGAVAVDDICQGIFHDSVNLSNNATADSDDSRGNFLFAGFHTVYFRITEVVETGRNSIFRYVLRPISERWKTTFHPSAQMTFVGYGNFSNKARQTSRYSTRTYERYLKDVADWEFTEDNIGAQFGDLSNLSVFGLNMTGYSAYLNNIYMTGRIEQIDAFPLYMTLDYENDNFLAYGETKRIDCRVFRGWEDVTDRVVGWTVTRDTGSPQDDAAWLLKPKVKNFSGSIDICFTDTENDLGTNDYVMSTLFTFKAIIGSGEEEETATYQLTI